MSFRLYFLDDSIVPREVAADEGLTTIGRWPEEGVVLNDRTVSRRHALIRREGDRVVIEDAGSTFGTFLNNNEVAAGGQAELRDGDIVRFGRVVAVCRFETAAEEPEDTLENAAFASQANARLLLLEGEVVRRRPIAGARTLIGSAPYCDVRLYDANAPAEQAVIRASAGGFHIEPRSADEPPILDERQLPVRSRTRLSSNSVILLRGAQALFLYDFDASGRPVDDPLRRIPRRRLLRHVASQCGVSRAALSRQCRDRRALVQSLGEVLVEKGMVTPLFWRVVCSRLEVSGVLAARRSTWIGRLRSILARE